MSATVAYVLVALILWVASLWALHWRLRGHDEEQQVELDDHDADLDHLAARVDAIANRLDTLERGDGPYRTGRP